MKFKKIKIKFWHSPAKHGSGKYQALVFIVELLCRVKHCSIHNTSAWRLSQCVSSSVSGCCSVTHSLVHMCAQRHNCSCSVQLGRAPETPQAHYAFDLGFILGCCTGRSCLLLPNPPHTPHSELNNL